MKKDTRFSKFKYKSICFNHSAKMYSTRTLMFDTSTRTLMFGEMYDIYIWDNGHSQEYEVHQDNEEGKDIYYTSFLIPSSGIYVTDRLEDYFYTEEQMRDIKLNRILDESSI